MKHVLIGALMGLFLGILGYGFTTPVFWLVFGAYFLGRIVEGVWPSTSK